MNNIYYITTSIPYVNSKPHIGFALELVQADVISRYHRQLGDKVFFQTGTDDNAYKNVLSAKETNVPTKEFVDINAKLFNELCGRLNVSHNNFIRTSGSIHRKGVEKFWKKLRQDDIYQGSYEGLYCTGCEDFLLESNLVNGLCPDHKTKPERIREKNFFFKLSSYEQKIEQLIFSDKLLIVPHERKNEVLGFIRQGLRDISVTRPSERVENWGIPVPGGSAQIIYVWIDALINYVSGLGFGENSDELKFWNSSTEKIHVIGKNVWKFHAVYWPALLLSAGLPLPEKILIHGFLTVNGTKISKSGNNAVDPVPVIDTFGADALRYYLLRYFSPFNDGDFTIEKLKSVYNFDLANDLGNLVSRLLTLCEKCNFEKIDFVSPVTVPEELQTVLDKFEFNQALEILFRQITEINREINQEKPWEKLKNGNYNELKGILSTWLNRLYGIAYWLSPFLPVTSRKITNSLSASTIKNIKPIFPRIK